MKKYNRVMLGQKSRYAEECLAGGFIGVHYGIDQDLTHELTENYSDFGTKFRPVYLQLRPEKTKIAAGLACGMVWTLSKGLNVGDIILSPDGNGNYAVGEVISEYTFDSTSFFPHQRKVKWMGGRIDRQAMSEALRNSTGSTGALADISKYADEIERLIGNDKAPVIVSTDDTVEDPSVFALERHLEDFLVKNWHQTELGKQYDIYSEEGEIVGQQFKCDTGNMDILAISKDEKTLLVVELKKGRASDNVVGQVQRYMGYVKSELAETDQEVRGVIIALEDDVRIQRALSVTTNIDFYKYEVSFRLYQ